MSDLHLGQHISRRFNEELEEVRSKVLHMGGVVETQLANALRVMVNDETELAEAVVDADSIVNSLEVEIDEECTRIAGSVMETDVSELNFALNAVYAVAAAVLLGRCVENLENTVCSCDALLDL